MAFTIQTFGDCLTHGFDTVIDVRAPLEFAEDHLPGALNLPVLDDAQRARVGTLYKQVAPFTARKVGAALVARNAATHIEGPLADRDGGWRPLVYCWRGGQRSGSFAAILGQIGWRVDTVAGGYRGYRAAVKTLLYETRVASPVVLLDGNTGTAKTDLLARVAARGHQTVDLEGLARHRGSVFGAIGAQPSQKRFETGLALALSRLRADRPVLIEAESSRIGARVVPPSLWSAMREAPRITIEAPVPARADYLVRAYRDSVPDVASFEATLALLRPLQGEARIERWRAMARQGEHLDLAAELIEQHYDPRYRRQRGAVEELQRIGVDRLDADSLERAADRIAAALDRLRDAG